MNFPEENWAVMDFISAPQPVLKFWKIASLEVEPGLGEL